MNLILISNEQWSPDDQAFYVRLDARQRRHAIQILDVEPGQQLRVGKLNGMIGKAAVIEASANAVVIEVTPEQLCLPPPPPSPIGLILALPRPKVARRLLRCAAELGVKHIHLINSYRVEKSYWQSPLLTTSKFNEQILLGLEQSGDTQIPIVTMHRRFKPFAEDNLPVITHNSLGLIAHPYAGDTLDTLEIQKKLQEKRPEKGPAKKLLQQLPQAWLAIGPEGGFIPYEIEKLEQAGLKSFNAGKRIMRTETAVPYLLAQLHAKQISRLKTSNQ